MVPYPLYPLIFLVALTYATVGHGGASGYLAALSLWGFSPESMAPGALALNLLVSGAAWLEFHRSGYFVPGLVYPFACASIPAAFVGGMLQVPPRLYASLLSAALVFAALRLIAPATEALPGGHAVPPRTRLALPLGAAIGFLSGIVGVGGGIFLSPILILSGWADAKRAAAASAGFIWVNSLAGLYGHLSRHPLNLNLLAPLVLCAFCGGLIGSRLGARRLGEGSLRRVLAVVLALAAFKLLRGAWS